MYRNLEERDANLKNEEDERYTDPVTGAHFEFNDICKRMIKLMKNKE